MTYPEWAMHASTEIADKYLGLEWASSKVTIGEIADIILRFAPDPISPYRQELADPCL